MEKTLDYVKDIRKCLTRDAKPTIEEFTNFALFFKQMLGVALGLLLPLLGITGWLGFVIFFAASNIILAKYSRSFLDCDEDTVELSRIYGEAFFPSMITFVFVWTIVHTTLHNTVI